MGRRGVTVQLKHVQRMIDKQGRERFYFRQPGFPRLTLPGVPGSPEFMIAYDAAKAMAPLPAHKKADAGVPGSFDRLLAEYFKSSKFLKNKPSSQNVTRGILMRFAADHGHRQVAHMEPKNMVVIMGKMSKTPAAANNLMKKLRVLFKFARLMGYCRDDPTVGVDRYAEGTHHTWTDDELAQFENWWPLGTRQRTGYAIALYTGQRCGDIASAVWSDINKQAGSVRVVQQKTNVRLVIPIHDDLRRALDAWPRKHATILPTEAGEVSDSDAFSAFMANAIDKAGLPERCVLHGLRKAAARRLAEARCTPHQIMAITGHKTLAEVARYTEAVDQEELAKQAIVKLEDARQARTKKG